MSKKRNPKIEKIVLPKKVLDKLNSNKNKTGRDKGFLTNTSRLTLIKRLSGVCSVCGDIATKKKIYEIEGGSLIEKYCDNHG